MTRPLFAFVLALLVTTAAARAQVDLAGDWTLTISGPQGVIDTNATFSVDGTKVTGVFSGPTGDASVAGTLDGAALTLSFSVATPQGVIDIKMTADVGAGEMKGVLDFGMGTADFTGKKK